MCVCIVGLFAFYLGNGLFQGLADARFGTAGGSNHVAALKRMK